MRRADVKKWVEAVHLLGIVTFFIGPLIVYFVFDEKEIKKSARVALNWQLSLLIYMVIASLWGMSSPFWMLGGLYYFWSGNILMNILIVINIIFCIIAFSKAAKNNKWDYPLSLKFIK